MCLAVPGKVIDRREGGGPAAGPTATVDFQGSRVEVSLAFTPEARVGDWVLVHAGFAITGVAEDEAREVWDLLACDEQFAAQTPGASAPPEEGGGR